MVQFYKRHSVCHFALFLKQITKRRSIYVTQLKSIPQTYHEAGIEFSFNQKYIRELMEFIKEKIIENEKLIIKNDTK